MARKLGHHQRDVLVALAEASCASVDDLYYRIVSAEGRVYKGREASLKRTAVSKAMSSLERAGLVSLSWSEPHWRKAASLTKRGRPYAVALQAMRRGIERAREAGVFDDPPEGE